MTLKRVNLILHISLIYSLPLEQIPKYTTVPYRKYYPEHDSTLRVFIKCIISELPKDKDS